MTPDEEIPCYIISHDKEATYRFMNGRRPDPTAMRGHVEVVALAEDDKPPLTPIMIFEGIQAQATDKFCLEQ